MSPKLGVIKFPQKPPNWHDLFYESIAEGHVHQIGALILKFAQGNESDEDFEMFRDRILVAGLPSVHEKLPQKVGEAYRVDRSSSPQVQPHF